MAIGCNECGKPINDKRYKCHRRHTMAGKRKSLIGWTFEDWYSYFREGGYEYFLGGKQERPIDIAEIFTTKKGISDFSTFGNKNNTAKKVRITIEEIKEVT